MIDGSAGLSLIEPNLVVVGIAYHSCVTELVRAHVEGSRSPGEADKVRSHRVETEDGLGILIRSTDSNTIAHVQADSRGLGLPSSGVLSVASNFDDSSLSHSVNTLKCFEGNAAAEVNVVSA